MNKKNVHYITPIAHSSLKQAWIQDFLSLGGGPTLSKKVYPNFFSLSTTHKAKEKIKRKKENRKKRKESNPSQIPTSCVCVCVSGWGGHYYY